MKKEDILDTKIIKLNSEAEQDFRLTDFNLKEKALCSANIKLKWLRVLSEEEKLLSLLEEKLDEYKFNQIKAFNIDIPEFKKKLDIDNSDQVKKINKIIKSQKEIIRFIEGVLKIASGFNFEIKNCIDISKLENN